MSGATIAGPGMKCGDPRAVCGRVVCGVSRPIRLTARPVRRPVRASARRGHTRRRSSRRARAPTRPADDDPSSLADASPRRRVARVVRIAPEDAVLAAVCAGSAAILNLTASQRRLLRDPEGARALSLLAHLLYARDEVGLTGDFPFAPGFLLRLARRLGISLGRNASRHAVDRLVAAGVLMRVGSYSQQYTVIKPSGFRVPLFRLTHIAWVKDGTRSFAGQRTPRSATSKASIATWRGRKLVPWWEVCLFGNPEGCKPPNESEGPSRLGERAWSTSEVRRADRTPTSGRSGERAGERAAPNRDAGGVRPRRSGGWCARRLPAAGLQWRWKTPKEAGALLGSRRLRSRQRVLRGQLPAAKL